MRTRYLRPGFTLVELLVVIAIIGILVTLLVPAVQQAREAGRRLSCKNNLKQIGIGSIQHHAKHNHYPSSGWGYKWTGDPDMGFGRSQPGGWAFNLLPYIEQVNVYDIGRGLDGSERQTHLAEQKAAVIALYHCPTRRAAIGYPAAEGSFNAAQPDKLAKTDYAANGGGYVILGTGPRSVHCVDTYPRWVTDDQDDPNYDPDCRWTHTDAWMAEHFDGISSERSEISSAHVIDGASCTIMIGEKYLNPNYYDTGRCCADNNSAYQGNDWDTNRWTPGLDANGSVTDWSSRYPKQDTPGFENCTQRFGSVHTTGFHVVMCDGSVHKLNYGIDQNAYARLGIRNDGVEDCDLSP
jgi:prepilin-type N-terminal cleavage/methylation domain-containing protein